MAFNSFTSVDDVVKKYNLRHVPAPLLPSDPTAPLLGESFRGELAFNLLNLPVGRSEIGAGEILLFPILPEVWRYYFEDLALFSHEGLSCDEDLTGTPDYFVCKVSPFGRLIPDIPYLLVAETKLDDFERAWGQCSAAMLAAQKLNQSPEIPVYGIVTNGSAWQFGILLGRELRTDPAATALSDLDGLSQRLHAVFRAVRNHAVSYARPQPMA